MRHMDYERTRQAQADAYWQYRPVYLAYLRGEVSEQEHEQAQQAYERAEAATERASQARQ